MQNKTDVPEAVNSAAALGVAPSEVKKQAMTPLSALEIMAVAGGPQVINRPVPPSP